MKLTRLQQASLLFACLAGGVRAHGAGPSNYPVHVGQVAQAIFQVHPELAGDAVELPAAILARDPEPVLEAGPIEHWAGATAGSAMAHIRVHCKGEGACLPFYATVHLGAVDTATSAPQSADKGAASPKPEPVLRAGSHVFMLIDSGRLHLRLPVTCLGNGSVGSSIRVAGPEHGKIYQVAVLDSGTVRGSL